VRASPRRRTRPCWRRPRCAPNNAADRGRGDCPDAHRPADRVIRGQAGRLKSWAACIEAVQRYRVRARAAAAAMAEPSCQRGKRPRCKSASWQPTQQLAPVVVRSLHPAVAEQEPTSLPPAPGRPHTEPPRQRHRGGPQDARQDACQDPCRGEDARQDARCGQDARGRPDDQPGPRPPRRRQAHGDAHRRDPRHRAQGRREPLPAARHPARGLRRRQRQWRCGTAAPRVSCLMPRGCCGGRLFLLIAGSGTQSTHPPQLRRARACPSGAPESLPMRRTSPPLPA
jgi:hypothetical protein